MIARIDIQNQFDAYKVSRNVTQTRHVYRVLLLKFLKEQNVPQDDITQIMQPAYLESYETYKELPEIS